VRSGRGSRHRRLVLVEEPSSGSRRNRKRASGGCNALRARSSDSDASGDSSRSDASL
jgi:hypothetical protein